MEEGAGGEVGTAKNGTVGKADSSGTVGKADSGTPYPNDLPVPATAATDNTLEDQSNAANESSNNNKQILLNKNNEKSSSRKTRRGYSKNSKNKNNVTQFKIIANNVNGILSKKVDFLNLLNSEKPPCFILQETKLS